MKQPSENIQKHLKQLAEIYGHAKQIILLAEEIDPSFRSNIMVIKELRDSHDHIMRFFNELLVNPDEIEAESDKYMLAQIDKARGHVYRSAYDAIDGLVVSYKIKVAKAMDKISNEAIDAVHSDYYTHAIEVDLLNEKIAKHRNEKDVADDSLQNLQAYAADAKKVAEFSRTALAKVPMMIAWDKKRRKKTIIENIIIAASIGTLIAVVGGIAGGWAEHYFNSEQAAKPSVGIKH